MCAYTKHDCVCRNLDRKGSVKNTYGRVLDPAQNDLCENNPWCEYSVGRRFGQFWVMTLAVYFSYFESLVGYRNALRSSPGTYNSLELQRLGVLKDFVCIG